MDFKLVIKNKNAPTAGKTKWGLVTLQTSPQPLSKGEGQTAQSSFFIVSKTNC